MTEQTPEQQQADREWIQALFASGKDESATLAPLEDATEKENQ